MRTRTTYAAVITAIGVALASSAASAQTADGFALNRFEPTPSGDVFFMAEHPWYSSTRVFSAGLTLDYAANPLVVQPLNGAQRSLVSGMLTGHIGAAVSFIDRIGLSVSMPVSLTQDGERLVVGTTSLGPADGPSPGDLRVGLRVRLFGHSDRDPISLHLGANLWLPTGSRVDNTGDESVRVEPKLTVAGRGGPVRWSFGAGFAVRSAIDEVNLAIGNELRFTAAVGVVLANERLTIGPEVYVLTAARDLPNSGGSALFAQDQWGGEAILGAHYLAADTVLIGLGGGIGLEQGGGVPAGRGMFTVAYAPVSRAPSDRDHDGVNDGDDVCPDEHQGASPDPRAERRGCPAADQDADGVMDHADACPTVPQGDHPDPNRAGCPLLDQDSDGVSDPDDVCPNEAQGATPDPRPERRGCPRGDRDGDAVFDDEDQCVDVAAGPRPSTVRRGCPAVDADHDGILDPPDGPDRCPTQAETFNGQDDEDGCPDGESLAQADGGSIRILQQVNFRTDRDEIIGARSFQVLDSVVSILRTMPGIQLDIQGHTDYRGTPSYNRDLSNRRAFSVRRYLMAHGAEESRLQSHGFGNDCPLLPGQGRQARAANRRVQFIIVSAATPAGQCHNPTPGAAVAPTP